MLWHCHCHFGCLFQSRVSCSFNAAVSLFPFLHLISSVICSELSPPCESHHTCFHFIPDMCSPDQINQTQTRTHQSRISKPITFRCSDPSHCTRWRSHSVASDMDLVLPAPPRWRQDVSQESPPDATAAAPARSPRALLP